LGVGAALVEGRSDVVSKGLLFKRRRRLSGGGIK